MTNSVDLDQAPHAAPDLDLHCLRRLSVLIFRVNMILMDRTMEKCFSWHVRKVINNPVQPTNPHL